MRVNPRVVNLTWKIAVIVLPMTILAFITFGFAQAAFYSINTDDNSINEWIPPAPEVPIFITDPDDDAGNGDEDVWDTYVASADEEGSDGIVDHLYFMIRTMGSPAIGSNFRAAFAALDCDNDGNFEEFEDRLVVYVPSVDFVGIKHGDQTSDVYGYGEGTVMGQRVGENIEWGIETAVLAEESNPAGYCQDVQQIRLGTATAPEEPPGEVIDTTDIGTFSIPTAVDMVTFSAELSNRQANLPVVLFGSLLITGMLVSIIFSLRRKGTE